MHVPTTDDTAMNAVRVKCSGGEVIPEAGAGTHFGEWRGMRVCPQGLFVAALKTQVEGRQGLWRKMTST